MRRLLCSFVTVLLALGLLMYDARPAAAAPYSVTTIHLAVAVEPDGAKHCDIVADLYRPTGAGRAHRVPAILMTNGFGGSKDTDAAMAAYFAANGYAVLAYSGLGFGGSTCSITFDSPDYDGLAASQLVGFLGGRSGLSFTDAAHTRPVAPPDFVVKDARDHRGVARPDDPRVGMWGTSYGGAVQLAAASIDPRIDTIMPIATWNDLRYSLTPNNADMVGGGVASRTPGQVKTSWGAVFGAFFGTSALSCLVADTAHAPGCTVGYVGVTSKLLASAALGYPTPGLSRQLGASSVATYGSRIALPTLLIQPQRDTLFNLNESLATYRQLKANGAQVKLLWISGGHSGPPIAGDYDLAHPDARTQYPIAR